MGRSFPQQDPRYSHLGSITPWCLSNRAGRGKDHLAPVIRLIRYSPKRFRGNNNTRTKTDFFRLHIRYIRVEFDSSTKSDFYRTNNQWLLTSRSYLMKTHLYSSACCFCLFFIVSDLAPAATNPQAVDLGVVKLVPTLDITQKRNDNIFAERVNATGSLITQVEPTLQFIAQQNNNVYALTFQGDLGFYGSSPIDDYADNRVTADLDFEFNSKSRLDITGSYGRLHDARGTGGSEGDPRSRKDPDEYNFKGASAAFEFGGVGNRLGLAFDGSYADIKYRNNLADTVFRDRKDVRVAARLLGRFSPKTRVFLEVASKDLNYDVEPLVGGSLNSDELSVMLGVKWEITGKTSGTAKGGRVSKDFDAASRGNRDRNNWEIEAQWSPRTYSTFFLTSSRLIRETNGTGDFIDSRETSVLWIHDWSARVHTRLDVGQGIDKFSNNPREDDLRNAGLKISYDFRRWINVGLGYSYIERESNTAVFNYSRRVYFLDISLSL